MSLLFYMPKSCKRHVLYYTALWPRFGRLFIFPIRNRMVPTSDNYVFLFQTLLEQHSIHKMALFSIIREDSVLRCAQDDLCVCVFLHLETRYMSQNWRDEKQVDK
jgi:hypothetical protein